MGIITAGGIGQSLVAKAGISTNERGLSLGSVGGSAPLVQFRDTAGALVIGITRLSIVVVAATASTWGLFRCATSGTPSSSNTALQTGNNQGFASGNVIHTAWSAAPTANPATLRYDSLPATIGARVDWEWPEDEPLMIPAGGSVAIFNSAGGASPACLVTARLKLFQNDPAYL